MQFNKGTSAMQHYVGLRPMFDVEVMNSDTALLLGDQDSQPSPSNVSRGLSSLYKDITGARTFLLFRSRYISECMMYFLLLACRYCA